MFCQQRGLAFNLGLFIWDVIIIVLHLFSMRGRQAGEATRGRAAGGEAASFIQQTIACTWQKCFPLDMQRETGRAEKDL